jgi:hypothetical protein
MGGLVGEENSGIALLLSGAQANAPALETATVMVSQHAVALANYHTDLALLAACVRYPTN